MVTRWIVLAVPCLFLLTAFLPAQEKKPDEKKKDEDAVHEELRAFKKVLVEAVKKGDVSAQLDLVTDDVVVTWQNGQVVKGRDNLRKFFDDNVKKSEMFKGYVKEPEPDALAVLYGGDTGISYGTSIGKYSLIGMNFELKNHWSATLTKQDGKWRIASYHVSANLLDNPVLNSAKTTMYWVGGIALVVGLAVGFLGGRFSGRSRTA